MRCTFVVICDTIHLLVVILSLRAEIKSGNVLWNNCRLYISNIYSIYLLFFFQILRYLITWAAVAVVFAQERVILDTVPCRVLETRQKVLGVQGIKSILISLDLGLKLPRKMLRAYRLKGDAEGTACLGNFTERLNLTVSGFGQKIGRLLREDQMTELYLNDERFMPSRFKHFDPGTLALLISALSFFIATTGLIVEGVRMNDMEDRLRLMSQHIDELRANQKDIYNSVEYLYEDGQFLGIEKDIMGDYVNGLKTTHSCEFLRVRGDTVIMKLESQYHFRFYLFKKIDA